MKRIFFFLLISFFLSNPVVAEIVFKNCDLSPNYGKVTMQVFLEKNKINFEDSNGISKILDINEKNSTNISANDNSNDQIRESFIIDLKHGVIRVTLEASDSADQSTKDLLKYKQNIINTICEPKNLYSKNEQQDQGVILSAGMEEQIMTAKKQCQMVGHKTGTDEQNHEMMGCVAYVYAKIEERNLSSKLKEKENIELKSDYESKSGEKITKDSKWQKFWSGVGWILQNHGEDIFNVILDVKYGTNYSGFNEQEVSSSGRLRCTHQRVGDIIYQNCRGGGTHIKCTYTILYETVFRKCREV